LDTSKRRRTRIRYVLDTDTLRIFPDMYPPKIKINYFNF